MAGIALAGWKPRTYCSETLRRGRKVDGTLPGNFNGVLPYSLLTALCDRQVLSSQQEGWVMRGVDDDTTPIIFPRMLHSCPGTFVITPIASSYQPFRFSFYFRLCNSPRCDGCLASWWNYKRTACGLIANVASLRAMLVVDFSGLLLTLCHSWSCTCVLWSHDSKVDDLAGMQGSCIIGLGYWLVLSWLSSIIPRDTSNARWKAYRNTRD